MKISFIYLILLFFFTNCDSINFKTSIQKNNKKNISLNQNNYTRIVSLAPSLTEIMFVLNADTQLAGVTEFCVYPQKALSKPKIGGYTNINFEQLVIIKPDLILALPIHQDYFKKFKQLNIPYKLFSEKKVSDIRNSIIEIGRLLKKNNETENFLKTFDNEFNEKINQTILQKPKILIIVGREFGRLKNPVCAGKISFYNDLIEFAGGINAAPESVTEYNSLNSESIVSMNPDIIIEIFAPHSGMTAYKDEDKLRNDWKIFKNVNAVKNGRIHYIIKDDATVPGPRIYLLYRDIKKIINFKP